MNAIESKLQKGSYINSSIKEQFENLHTLGLPFLLFFHLFYWNGHSKIKINLTYSDKKLTGTG